MCWSSSITAQLVVAIVRSGFTSQGGLLENSGYDGGGARRGLVCTVHRLVRVPRPGQEPLYVVVVTGNKQGMNWGTCHAPAPAMPCETGDLEGAAVQWKRRLGVARTFLSAEGAAMEREGSAYHEGANPLRLRHESDHGLLRARGTIHPSERPPYPPDVDMLDDLEDVAGGPIYTVEPGLDAPFPAALYA